MVRDNQMGTIIIHNIIFYNYFSILLNISFIGIFLIIYLRSAAYYQNNIKTVQNIRIVIVIIIMPTRTVTAHVVVRLVPPQPPRSSLPPRLKTVQVLRRTPRFLRRVPIRRHVGGEYCLNVVISGLIAAVRLQQYISMLLLSLLLLSYHYAIHTLSGGRRLQWFRQSDRKTLLCEFLSQVSCFSR